MSCARPSPLAEQAAFALLGPRDLDSPFAWRAGRPLSARQFLIDTAHQAACLPERSNSARTAINLCADRYHFAVMLAAAMQRGYLSLFPPNALPSTLVQLKATYPELMALSDEPSLETGDLPRFDLTAILTDQLKTSALTPPIPEFDAAQVATCLLTSGSTGMPQPHIKHWGTLTRNIAAAAPRLAQRCGLRDLVGLNIVATVPPQHSFGFESTILLAMLAGAAFEAGRPFYPADITAALARLPRPRALVTTPFHLRILLMSGSAVPAVDLVLCATAPLSPQLAQRAEETVGGPLIEIYGSTETGQIASRRTAAGELWHTFGNLNIQHAAAADSSSRSAFYAHGGHIDIPTALADILELQDANHFHLLGRANDLIHVAGKRTSLSHLNYHLNCVDGVLDGAFWMPREIADSVVRPLAFVVAPALSAAHITAELRARIETSFLPRRVIHVNALPRDATGKLPQQALHLLAQTHTGTATP